MAEKDPADLISALGKKYGKLVQVSTGDTIEEIEKLSSGSLSLDVALGGGYGKGKLVEMYGPESSGKTLLSMLALMQAQKDFPDKWTGIIDAEHAFNKEFHVGLGLNPINFYHIDPADGETGFNVLLDMVKSNMFSLIIIDSVSAMQPKNIVEGDVGTPQMASHARLMSDAMSKLVPAAEKAGTTLILINQLREKIGVMFGSPEVTTGGNSLKFYASQRIDVRRKVGSEKDENGDPTYNDIKCKVIKNKLGPPLRTAELKFYYDRGIDNSYDVLRLGIELGLIKKSGSWFSVDDTRLGQGEENALTTLKENPDLFEEIENKIREHYGIK